MSGNQSLVVLYLEQGTKKLNKSSECMEDTLLTFRFSLKISGLSVEEPSHINTFRSLRFNLSELLVIYKADCHCSGAWVGSKTLGAGMIQHSLFQFTHFNLTPYFPRPPTCGTIAVLSTVSVDSWSRDPLFYHLQRINRFFFVRLVARHLRVRMDIWGSNCLLDFKPVDLILGSPSSLFQMSQISTFPDPIGVHW